VTFVRREEDEGLTVGIDPELVGVECPKEKGHPLVDASLEQRTVKAGVGK